MIKPVIKRCLSCKYYEIKEEQTGFCRMENLTTGNRQAEKPAAKADDCCEKWRDCGQTYFIRLGWLKNMAANKDQAG